MRTRTARRFNKALTLMLGVGTLAGVLIWAKLRLVTDIPRTVLAEPEDELSNDRDPSESDPGSDPDASENADPAESEPGEDRDPEHDEDPSSTDQP